MIGIVYYNKLMKILQCFVFALFACRPDSIICKICEPTVKEKPGGGSARRRSAKSGRGSAAKYAAGDEEAAVGDTAETAPEDAASTTDDLSSLQTEEEEVPDTEPVEADGDGGDTVAEEVAEDPAPEEKNDEAATDEEMEDMD